MADLHSQILNPIPISFLYVGLESESDPVLCEKFYVVQCSDVVCNPNDNRNRNEDSAM